MKPDHKPTTPDDSFIVWKCPVCGWLVADILYMNIVFDAPCPRCGTKYSKFSMERRGKA